MALTTAKRLVNTGFTNFFRNIWLSLAATSIMAITLFIISTILVLYTLTTLSIENIQDRVGITAYFNNQTSEREILNVKAEIELLDNVEAVEYIPNTVARDIFMEIHKNEPLLLETLEEFDDGENPLPNSLAIRANGLENYAQLSETLQSDRYAPYFQRVRDNGKVISRLLNITNIIRNLGIVLTVVFVTVTIMVMFNTIRLTIHNRRQEVEIMRLVGATNSYIRTPFIIEGVMYGLIATVITSLIMFAALQFASGSIESLLSLEPGIAAGLARNLTFQVIGLNLALGIGLGVIASAIAMRRYLKI
jgi:cell division transport system permease protein